MRSISLLLIFALAACAPSFDEQYADTEKQLKADAERLDRDMAAEAAKEPGAD
ncbi:MAG: hypothetical protein SFV20_01040 [Sphingopyxis sp.]|nr:hypothetical protein [Sphingopyxis sp.]